MKRTFSITLHGSEFAKPRQPEHSLTLEAGQRGEIPVEFEISPDAPAGTQVYTASIASEPDIDLRHWIEGLLHVEE